MAMGIAPNPMVKVAFLANHGDFFGGPSPFCEIQNLWSLGPKASRGNGAVHHVFQAQKLWNGNFEVHVVCFKELKEL